MPDLSIIRRAIRAWRRWWGLCPACNSDAPAVYECEECRVGWRFQKHPERCEFVFCVPQIYDETDGMWHKR